MRSHVAFLAACLLYAGIGNAADTTCRNNWPQIHNTNPGIVLTSGIEGFKRNQPAPADLLEKLGPLLCAAGTEELLVVEVGDRSYFGDPARHAERIIRLVEVIHGREVRLGFVSISLNIETNRVAMIDATFLPDRDVDHEPQLTAAQAKAKVAAHMRDNSYVELKSGERVRISLGDARDAHLAYDIEQVGFASPRGVLVWVFRDGRMDDLPGCQIGVDSATGEVVKPYCVMSH